MSGAYGRTSSTYFRHSLYKNVNFENNFVKSIPPAVNLNLYSYFFSSQVEPDVISTPIESPVPKTNGISKPTRAEIPQPAPRRVNLTQNTNDASAKQQSVAVANNNTTTVNPQKQPVNGTAQLPNQNNPSKPEQNTTSAPSGGGGSDGTADEQVLQKPITNEEFQAMIPAHFLNKTTPHNDHNNTEPPVHAVTVTVKKPDPIELPPPPTGPGRVTETITKSTFTETVVTRITDNKLVVPVVIEVCPTGADTTTT